MRRTFASLIIVVFLASSLNAQTNPAPILVDEHGILGCDEMLSRLDAYYQDLRNDPGSTGVIVIFGPPDKKHRVALEQAFFEGSAKWREFDLGRIKFLRARSDEKIESQFWRVPRGVAAPDIPRLDMSLTLPSTLKPFKMGEESNRQICPEVDEGEIFASFLKANPDARGNLVVRDTSLRGARLKAPMTLRNFSSIYGIPRTRLRVFAATYTDVPGGVVESDVEYWYLPW